MCSILIKADRQSSLCVSLEYLCKVMLSWNGAKSVSHSHSSFIYSFIHLFILSPFNAACLSLAAIQQYCDVSRWHTKAGSSSGLLTLIFRTPHLNYSSSTFVGVKSERLSVVESVSKNVSQHCAAGFNQIIPGGPVTEQYQRLYLTSEVAVFLYSSSLGLDEVLPLGPVSCVHSCIRGRIGCAW